MMKTEEINPKFFKYSDDILNGNIPSCEYIKLACRRYKEWFSREDIEFRPKTVEKVVKFCRLFKHYTGSCKDKPFELSDWQFFIVCNIFGWYYKGTSRRVTRNVYIEVGRKNGKSALASILALYCLCEEAGSEVDVVANSRQQARILFEMCGYYGLTLDPKQKVFKQFRDKIKFPSNKGFLQVLAAEASRLDGFNSSCFIEDELHEAKDSKLYDVLKSSQGMRDNPLAICITSAGFNKFGFCYTYRTVCIEILRDLKEDDSQFSVIYALDESDDWRDEKNWHKANPNLGVTVKPEFLREAVKQAINNPATETSTKTKHFGLWTDSQNVWIPQDILLQSSEDIDLNEPRFKNVTSFIGIDLSAVSDISCFSVCIPLEDKYYFKTYYYLPESCLEGNVNSVMYRDWKNKGLLNITSGNVIDYDYILKDMLSVSQTVFVRKVAYDSWNATQFAINATAEGLPLEPFSQNLGNFNRPTKEFTKLILSGKVVLDNNEITRWMFRNAVLKEDFCENVKPIKSGNAGENRNKIDGVISIIESLGAYLTIPIINIEI